ncbi:MAG: thioredoxin family protein [Microcoleaceae cyanobacterium]
MTHPNSSTDSPTTPIGTRLKNLLITLVAIALSVALVLGLRTDLTSTSLSELSETATPIDVALENGKPTLMEFYANWCTSCQAMAEDMAQLRQQYEGQVNFVMLNVDNSKWLPEVLEYRVDGIPHFVFLNKQAEAIAQTIGEIPRSVMSGNLDSLIEGNPLPYATATGKTSTFETNVTPAQEQLVDPRSHSGQQVSSAAR